MIMLVATGGMDSTSERAMTLARRGYVEILDAKLTARTRALQRQHRFCASLVTFADSRAIKFPREWTCGNITGPRYGNCLGALLIVSRPT